MAQIGLLYRGLLGFGPYPAPPPEGKKKKVMPVHKKLQNFRYFVDLTESPESYQVPDGAKYLHYGIEDEGIPEDEKLFARFLQMVKEKLEAGESVYIHCEHGKGRTGVVVVCLMALLYGIDYQEALEQTNRAFHDSCPAGSSWLHKTIPCHSNQKEFCKKFISYGMAKSPSKMSSEKFVICHDVDQINLILPELVGRWIIFSPIFEDDQLLGLVFAKNNKIYAFPLVKLIRQKILSRSLAELLISDTVKIGPLAEYVEEMNSAGYPLRNFIDLEHLARISDKESQLPEVKFTLAAWKSEEPQALQAELEYLLTKLINIENFVKPSVIVKDKLTDEDLAQINFLEVNKAVNLLSKKKELPAQKISELLSAENPKFKIVSDIIIVNQ